MRFKDYASLVGDIKEVNFDKVAMRDNDFTLESEMPVSWLELEYIDLRKDCEAINKAKNTLRHDKGFDITPLREQENKYKFVLKVLEREIFNDTEEQHDKALELLKSLEGKTLGKKEQEQLLANFRSIYDRTLPTESDFKKHGLSRWLLYLKGQDFSLYYTYKPTDTRGEWSNLVITFMDFEELEEYPFYFDINKNGLPF